MMIIAKEVELTLAGKVALLEARLNHVRGLNRVYDFRTRAKGYYTDLSRIMADIVTQEEIKKQIRILQEQINTLKPFIPSDTKLSLEEELLVNQAEQELYAKALDVYKNEWEQSTGDYKAMCYNQIEAINKRVAYLSKQEALMIERVLVANGVPTPEEAPAEDVILVDHGILAGTLQQLGLCETHIQHAINLMTVKAVG